MDLGTGALVTVVAGVGAAVAAPYLALPALGAIGFTSAGVAGGSIAAGLQTSVTAAGSIFALCQSAGAAGAVAASTNVIISTTAGITAAAVAGTNVAGTVGAIAVSTSGAIASGAVTAAAATAGAVGGAAGVVASSSAAVISTVAAVAAYALGR
eukprot:Colp12_sorted_trinity150504_noHs@2606